MLKKLITIWLCSVLLSISACKDPDETTGSNIISTSEIGLNVSVSVYDDGSSFVRATVRRAGDGRTDLRLGNGDQLLLRLDDSLLTLEERVWVGNLMFPENHYYYERTLTEDISLRNVSVEFVRSADQDASSPVVFGAAPNIISPLPEAVYSRSADDVTVTIEADSSTSGNYIELRQLPCSYVEYFNELETVLTLPAGTNRCQAGEVNLQVTRHWRSEPGSIINQEISDTTSRISRSVTVQYIP